MSQTSPTAELRLERKCDAKDGDEELLGGLVGGERLEVSLHGRDDDGDACALESKGDAIRVLLVADDDGEVCVVEVDDVNEVDTVVVVSVQVEEEVVAVVGVSVAEVVAEEESTEDMDIRLKHCDMYSCRGVGSLEDFPCDLEALADLLFLPFSAPSPPSAVLPFLGVVRTFLPTTCWAEAFSASLSRAVRDLKKLGFF